VNPYIIDGPAQVGVSGGRTSGRLAKHIQEANPPRPDLVFVFENTGEECEETLAFLHRMESQWELPLVWLEYDDHFNIEDYRKSDGTLSERRQRRSCIGLKVVDYSTAARRGEPYEQMLAYFAQYRREVKQMPKGDILPTLLTRMCTSQLKIKVAEKYMLSLGYKDHTRVVGIRYDEPSRWQEVSKPRYECQLPLVDDRVTKTQVNQWWREQSFNLELDEDSVEGNCRHCFLKHPNKAIAIIKKSLRRNDGHVDAELQRWLDRESRAQMFFRRDRPSYEKLVQIARTEIETGKQNEYDFTLSGDYSCNCSGTTGAELELEEVAL
jgi:hypothetical protein